MSIHFEPERWERVRDVYAQFWAGELARPLIAITLTGYPPDREEPPVPDHSFEAFYGPEVSVEQIVDRWDYELSRQRFAGDAFPTARPNFGPEVLAAFLGATPVNGAETVWCQPPEEQGLADLHFEFRTDTYFYQRITALLKAAMERWEGQVLLGLTDLGGTVDTISTFRPAGKLPLDLYDHPEEVKRLTWELHDLWWRYFEDLNGLVQAPQRGYTCWTPLYSAGPYYMLQCDFAYMLSPRMYEEFVLPELTASCRRLEQAFYHLDGIGALPQLDLLLSIPELHGIQWVPGEGKPDVSHWPHVYRRIREAGKLIQVFTSQADAGLGIIDLLAEQLGDLRGVAILGQVDRREEDQVAEVLARYGVDELR